MYDNLFPIVWEDFHFLRPQFLWLLPAVMLVFILQMLSLRQQISWRSMIASHLRPYVIQKGSERIKLWMFLSSFVLLILGVLALSGPAWKQVELPGQKLETPMVILLDLSQSMLAEDMQPNRLERAKFKIRDLLTHNPQARAALIGFAGTAHTIVPLTEDYDIILSHIDGLSPSVMPYPGSDLEAALLLADTLMSVTEAPGTVLIFSDDFEEAHFDLLSTYSLSTPHTVEVMAMNTLSGSDLSGFQDAEGQVVHSALQPQLMRQLASLERVNIHQLTLDDSDMEKISKEIGKHLIFTSQPEDKEDSWRDAGLLLVLPMAFLLLLWFRKGWVLYMISSLCLLASCGEVHSFEDLWFTPDYQGQRLSDQGDYETAAAHFTDPMRKGVAYFKAKNYEEAIHAFSDDTTAQGAYNLGLAYFENGDTAAARMVFGLAAEMDPEMEQAKEISQQLEQLTAGTDEMDPEEAEEADKEVGEAQNMENQDMEDLGGGGQEATKEDMQKERKEETVATDIRKGKELEEVPDDIGATSTQENSKVLMRKVDDDPSIFLKRKFAFQVKEKKIKPKDNTKNGSMQRILGVLCLCWCSLGSLQAQQIWSQVSLDRTSVYVGQPVEVRISVFTSTWFTSGIDLGNIKVNGAFTVYFRPVSRTERQNGKTYAGVDLLYHVFPYDDKNIVFPSLEIEVESPPEGDFKGKKRLLRTEEKQINVKPIPPNFDESQWLVATGLSLSDHWSSSLDQLKVGDVLERRISRTAFGTVSELIPPIQWDSLPGSSMYPTRAAVENQKTKSAISATRTESMRYLFEKEGEFVLPEMVFSWYNPYQKKLLKRTLPEVNIKVVPNPDLGMLASIRDSLQSEQQAEQATTEESPLMILGMSPGRFALLLVAVLLGLYLLYKLSIWLIHKLVEQRKAYRQSEAYYFHRFISTARQRTPSNVPQALYRWIDELALKEASVHAFIAAYGSDIMKIQFEQAEQHLSQDHIFPAIDVKEWKNARKSYLHQQKLPHKSLRMDWINP